MFRAEEPSATRHQNQVLELERTGTDGLSNPAALTLVKNVQASELATLLSFDRDKQTLAGGPGSNDEHVAEVSAWHSNLSKETRRMLSKWSELQG